MTEILQRIQRQPAFQQLLANSRDGSPGQLGLIRSARLPLAAALAAASGRTTLLLSHRRDRALAHFEELGFWAPAMERLYFPEPSSLFYENAPWSETARRERLAALARLALPAESGAVFITASARALMSRTLSPAEFGAAAQRVQRGARSQPAELAAQLARLGYEAAQNVVAAGQFARRGGILDLWPMHDELPARLEYFGDELDSLRRFDPATQRTIHAIDDLLIPPAREYLVQELLPEGLEARALNEFHIPLLHPEPAGLLDYLPADALVLVDDLDALRDQVSELETQALQLRQENLEAGSLAAEYPAPYLSLSELEELLAERNTIELGPALAIEDAHSISGLFRPGPRFGGQLKPMLDQVERYLDAGDEVLIVSRQTPRLSDMWAERNYGAGNLADPQFAEGSLAEGWSLESAKEPRLHLLTDGEVFGWERPQPRRQPRPESQAPETPYVDLQNEELVVHIDHGIGIFRGLVEAKIEGKTREFLRVEYAGGDQLYVPVHQADRLSRYIGSRGETPTLSRLGGQEWRSTKSRVRRAVEAIAEDLLELYAKREMAQGHAYPPDVPWQHELEASFPYVETEDQLRVLAEVKQDMQNTRPMDRLVCGDAGYGKTEIALRAAFKAVMDGKQVAMLVPTTVLAQQHYETFRQRLAAFPVRIEMLSRFRDAKQQQDTIRKLAAGEMDIVIGTHRLVQADVKFKDLGLVIIDEEQRFGVAHKEHLKKLRTEVDVLTMTATPIPRTLYMALTGVRDISTINTPPEERLPIVTHVGPYSEQLVRRAVLRELDRGGQIFFVHNRVHSIDAMRSHLQRVVPEVRIGVAHGQMAERELAERMNEFSRGEIDLLLTTTIIESGLDIPNANTLIVDRADAFGLAQLYQLRGRVGRGAQRAYAYFFRHAQNGMTDEGRQRLETIAENTQHGAGFSVAMRDLEIRGAGDLLGVRQHGLIAAVGFHLYTRLLSKAVDDLKRVGGFGAEAGAVHITLYHPLINVDLPIEVGIPASYVNDKAMRLKLYRRLADIHDASEIEALEEEFRDRFGPPPAEVQNLLFQLHVRVLAERTGLTAINVENKQLALRFPPPRKKDQPMEFTTLPAGTRTSKNTVWLSGLEGVDWRQRLLSLLEALVELNAQKAGAPLPAEAE
ncbi:MAG: transcription-repair coupling factor [Anaerolineales bacterium]|nr:MAG: transcription-repair coupling factor [Anaerolineales bacterium]